MGQEEMDFLREKAREADEVGAHVEPVDVTSKYAPGMEPSDNFTEGDAAYKKTVARELEAKMLEADRIAKAKKVHEEIKNILDKAA